MRTVAALLLLSVAALAVTAQQPETVDLAIYGDPGADAARGVAEDLGASFKFRDVAEGDIDLPCFAVCKGVARADAPGLLAVALGNPVAFDGKSLTVFQPQTAAPGGRVKGYDVSVPAGRFVEYVNTYGSTRKEARPGDEDSEERTAAEHLAAILDEVLYERRGQRVEASVVGDRLLYTLDDAGHARVREVLDLLNAEGGGESAALKAERELIEKLKQAKFKGDLSGTPVSSVFAAICGTAGVGLVLGRDLGAFAVEWHIDFVQEEEVSAWEAMGKVFELLEEQEYPVEFTARAGVAVVELRGGGIRSGYRVYDVAELLKKLTASYQRQRTAPGKEDGFGGDVRADGGSDVVVDALEEQLTAAGAMEGMELEAYGARLIVRGGAEGVDAATSILKEMGWEE